MKFLFGDRAKVIAGFYKGAVGRIADYKKFPMENCYDDYYFDGYKIGAGFIIAWINEKELEKVEE